MKLNVKKITILLFIGCLFLSASKPSIDGRALVANEGDLPVGLFAKSATYLPGDTVVVTNPATNISIEVMIFGSFDSSEGIAIILSPEAAKKLFIEKGSSSLVRITKSSIKDSEPQLFSESISNTKQLADPDKDPMLHIEDSVPYEEESEHEETTPIDSSQIEKSKPEDLESDKTTIPEKDVVITDEPVDLLTVEQSTDKEATTETEKIIDEKEIETTEEETTFYSPFADDATIIAKENLIETSVETIPDPDSTETTKTPEVETVPEIKKEPLIQESPVALEKSETPTNEEETTDDFTQPTESLISPEPEVLEVVPAKETTESEMTDEVEIIEPNTLVPSVLTPPESNVIVLETSEQDKDKESKEDIEKIETTMIEDPNAFLPAIEDEKENVLNTNAIEKTKIAETVNIQDYIIDNETVLGTNNYYIQLATYKQMDNIINIINKYTEKYPIKLVKYEKLDAYRIILGPLNEDEYPIVLKRFVKDGFTDAFLRKIK